jgi:hypothetical protein
MKAKTTISKSVPRLKSRKYEMPLSMAWALVTLCLGNVTATYLFLIHLYGFARVRGDNLYFTEMPKGRAWIVSNGDKIADGHFLHFLMSVGFWLVLFFLTYGWVRRLLPVRKDSNAIQNSANGRQERQA